MNLVVSDVIGWVVLAAVMGLCFGIFGTIGGSLGNWIIRLHHKNLKHWEVRLWQDKRPR